MCEKIISALPDRYGFYDLQHIPKVGIFVYKVVSPWQKIHLYY